MAFGKFAVTFKGRTETMEAVFGSKPLKPGEMMKKLWSFIKENKLTTEKKK